MPHMCSSIAAGVRPPRRTKVAEADYPRVPVGHPRLCLLDLFEALTATQNLTQTYAAHSDTSPLVFAPAGDEI